MVGTEIDLAGYSACDEDVSGPGSNGRENNALPGHSLDGAASDAEPDVAAVHIRCFRGHCYRDPKLGPRQVKLTWQMYDEKDETGKRKYTVQQIADEFGVTRPTIYRHLSKAIPQT